MENYEGIIHVDSHAYDSRTKNTIATFTNYTPGRFIYNEDGYEVGLTEIMFPHSWYNVPSEQYIGVFDKNGVPVKTVAVPPGHYEDIDALIDHMNALIYEYIIPADVKPSDPTAPDVAKSVIYYNNTKTIRFMKLESIPHEIVFTLELAQILGFTNNFFTVYTKRDHQAVRGSEVIRITSLFPSVRLTAEKNMRISNVDTEMVCMRYQSRMSVRHKPERPFDITCGTDQLFIYCNLIKPHVFGNQIKQILRVIPVYQTDLAHFGQISTRSFSNPQFYPLFETSFDKIEIEIRDRLGRAIEFKSGSVIVTLEIRKKPNGGFLC